LTLSITLLTLTYELLYFPIRGKAQNREVLMTTSTVSDDNFEQEVLKSTEPVLVDFWAEWCGPCKQIAPALEEIASELGGKVKITKLNIDENPDTPTKFGIRAIPTLMIFKDGEVSSTQMGVLPKSKIVDWINENT